MPELVVFNNIKAWVPPLISRKRYIEVPRVSIDLRVPYAQDILAKQQQLVSKHFDAAFDPKFSSTSKESFAALQSDIDTIENMVENVKGGRVRMSKEDMQTYIASINSKLKSLLDAWKARVEQLASDCFNTAVAKSDVDMKNKVKRAKMKAILKVVLVAAVVLTAAAVTVATAGAAAPVLAAAIVGLVVAVAKTGLQLKTALGDSSTLCAAKMTEIRSDLGSLESFLSKESPNKWQTAKAGTVNLVKHAGQLEKYRHEISSQVKQIRAQSKSLEEKTASVASPELKTKFTRLNAVCEVLDSKLASIDALLAEATNVTKLVEAEKVPNLSALRKFLDAAGQIKDAILPTVKSPEELFTKAAQLV